ncbi:MAG: hypothetical protein G5663_07305 [Serratia symbiotica]|nr:hypothetical protein [Serratia symbiotica]
MSLTFRALQGFVNSIFTLMKVPLNCPDYICLSKRAKSVNVPFKNPTPGVKLRTSSRQRLAICV